MSQPQAHQPSGMIDINPSYMFLAFLLMLFKPKASINGSAPFDIKWGSNPIPVAPGRYQVEIWLPYLFFTQMGKNGAVVDVPDGGAVQVNWRAPWLVILAGKVTVQGPFAVQGGSQPGAQPGAQHSVASAPPTALVPGSASESGAPASAAPASVTAASVPAAEAESASAAPVGGWFPDPTGRHESRYYDGQAWTDHVASGGTQSTDPIGS